MSDFIDPAQGASPEIKPASIDASKMIGPLAPIQNCPCAPTSIASEIGVIVEMSGERIISATNLAQAHSILARKVVLAIGVDETARANQAAQAESRL